MQPCINYSTSIECKKQSFLCRAIKKIPDVVCMYEIGVHKGTATYRPPVPC